MAKLFYSDYGMINKWRLFLSGFLIAWPLLVCAVPAKITTIQISNTVSPTRITIKLSVPNKPRIFTLAHPDRLVFDFTDTRLGVKLQACSFTNPNITSIRSGQPQPGMLRLVFDLAHAFHYKTINSLPAQQITVALSPLAGSAKNPRIATQKKPSNIDHVTPPLIVMIDPGHGGKDTGAIGDSGTREKDVVLNIAKQLAELVNKDPHMKAVLTRSGDYYVTLHNRLVYARQNKADVYISIHADSYFNKSASGASVFALSKNGATSIAARWLARRDNYSELQGVELSELNDQSPQLRSVLIDLAQTATVTNSMRLGTSLLDALDDVAMLHYARVEQAPFMVLKSPDIPSILVETGFLSNPKEEVRLHDKAYQRKVAVALFNGIQRYQKKYFVVSSG